MSFCKRFLRKSLYSPPLNDLSFPYRSLAKLGPCNLTEINESLRHVRPRSSLSLSHHATFHSTLIIFQFTRPFFKKPVPYLVRQNEPPSESVVAKRYQNCPVMRARKKILLLLQAVSSSSDFFFFISKPTSAAAGIFSSMTPSRPTAAAAVPLIVVEKILEL